VPRIVAESPPVASPERLAECGFSSGTPIWDQVLLESEPSSSSERSGSIVQLVLGDVGVAADGGQMRARIEPHLMRRGPMT